jgi:NADH dehydrogenase
MPDEPPIPQQQDDDRPVLVTGGNGQMALQLFCSMARHGIAGRAVVRSQRAADKLSELPERERPEVRILDYKDTAALTKAASGCRAIVHLVGILKEGEGTRYVDAHESTCAAVAEAAASQGLARIVYLSIFGSRPDSPNACLASKGRAEEILHRSKAPTTVLRVPMVIGPDDPASRALRAQATKSWQPLIGGGATIQQPLDVRDLLGAIVGALADNSEASHGLDFGGPEALRHRDLVAKAAALYGNQIQVLPIPLVAMKVFATLMERTQKSPPITSAMLGVLQHDDRIDNSKALQVLGTKLTPLDDTLARYIGPRTQADTDD